MRIASSTTPTTARRGTRFDSWMGDNGSQQITQITQITKSVKSVKSVDDKKTPDAPDLTRRYIAPAVWFIWFVR